MEIEVIIATVVAGFAKVICFYSCSRREIYMVQSGLRVDQHFNAIQISAFCFPE